MDDEKWLVSSTLSHRSLYPAWEEALRDVTLPDRLMSDVDDGDRILETCRHDVASVLHVFLLVDDDGESPSLVLLGTMASSRGEKNPRW